MSSNKPHRNVRMVNKQKDELLHLLQMYFIRTVGRSGNVLGIHIDKKTWEIFAQKLNACGPPKHADEWEKSFYYMKLRVKAKKDQMMKRCMESGQLLTLNDFNDNDRLIVQMFYPENIGVYEETGNHEDSNVNQISLNQSGSVWYLLPEVNKEETEKFAENDMSGDYNENDENIVQIVNPENVAAIEESGSLQNSSDPKQILLNESDCVWIVLPEVNEEEAETVTDNHIPVTRVVSSYDPENIGELTEYIELSEEQEPADNCRQMVHQQSAELSHQPEKENPAANSETIRVTRVVSSYDPENISELMEYVEESEEQELDESCRQMVHQQSTELLAPSLSHQPEREKPAANSETMSDNHIRVTRVVSAYDPENISELTEYIEQFEDDLCLSHQVEKEKTAANSRQLVHRRSLKRPVNERGRLNRNTRPARGGRKRVIARRRQPSSVNRASVVRRRILEM